MAWVAAASAGASLISGFSGASKQSKLQKQALAMQREAANLPMNYSIGGITAGNTGVNLGQFGSIQDLLTRNASSLFGDLGGGIPDDVVSAYGRLGAFSNGPTQFEPELMRQLLSGAGGLAGDMSRGYQSTYDSTLSLLRQKAAPEEERAFQGLNQNLFNTGRMGTTGGAMQTEAFARGLGQVDLDRQLAAGQEARNVSADVMARFQALFGGGMQLQGANERLSNTNYDRSWQRFKDAIGMAQLPTQLQSGRASLGGSFLTAAQGINDMGLNVFDAGNAMLQGKRSALTGVANQTMNVSRNASPVADAFGAFSAGLLNASGGLNSLFSRFRSQPGADPNQLYQLTGQVVN
jgi:hypothetical protein